MVGIVGLDRAHEIVAEAERAQDRVRCRHHAGKARHVMLRLLPRKQRDAGSAERESGGEEFVADLRDFVHAQRQHTRGQAVAETRERIDHRFPVVAVMQQHDRVRAAGLRVSQQQRAQATHQRVGRRQRVGGRARGADGRAGRSPRRHSRRSPHGRRSA